MPRDAAKLRKSSAQLDALERRAVANSPTLATDSIGVPSDVLQRRPDVASAGRSMAAANAQIGVATAAFYPSMVLGPAYGVESSRWLRCSARRACCGRSAYRFPSRRAMPEGCAPTSTSRAKGYDVVVANYRRVVLTAMQEAEDGITGLAALESAAAQAQLAIASARHVLDLATSRYEGGVTTYLDVITAQQSLLNSERLAAQLQGQRLVTSVFLVKPLGWTGRPSLMPRACNRALLPITATGSANRRRTPSAAR